MPEQISVAVIGAGMAGRSHAAAYRMAGSVSGPGLPPVRLAAIADANVALAEDGARRYGYEKALPSWQAVAEDPSIDAVSIVVGNALHRPIAEALVAAGKHVLCEKPLAPSRWRTPGRWWSWRSGRKGHGRRLLLSPVPRSPQSATTSAHGELGELTTLHARYWCDYACDPRGPLSWRFKGGMGSGALGRHRRAHHRPGEYLCGPIASVSGGDVSIQIAERPLPLGRSWGRRRSGEQRDGRGGERGPRHVHRPVPVRLAAPSRCRAPLRHADGLGFDLYGTAGRLVRLSTAPSSRFSTTRGPRPARQVFRPRGGRRPPDAVLQEAAARSRLPGVGSATGAVDCPARAFLDRGAPGVADQLPPNASISPTACAAWRSSRRS